MIDAEQSITSIQGGQSTVDPGPKEGHPRRIRIPGFVADSETGLGDVLKRATRAIGIPACGGCSRRADTLNRWFVLEKRTARNQDRF